MTVLQVILPLAFVLAPVSCPEFTEPICFVTLPVASVNVAVSVAESAFTAGLIFLPLSLITSPITPCHLAFAVSRVPLPLTLIDCSRAVFVGSCLSLCVWYKPIGLLGLYLREVFNDALGQPQSLPRFRSPLPCLPETAEVVVIVDELFIRWFLL